MKSVPVAKSRLANEVKRSKHKPDPTSGERVKAARRDLAAAKLENYIATVVAGAPPLLPEQRSKLAALLHGTSPFDVMSKQTVACDGMPAANHGDAT